MTAARSPLLQVAAAEWRQNAIWMVCLFALTGAVWLGITYLPGQDPVVNLSIMSMVSAVPLMMCLVTLGADQAQARRAARYAASSLSSGQQGLAHGLVLVLPWTLALINAGLMVWQAGEPAKDTVLLCWSGLLLVFATGHWLLGVLAGSKAALVVGLATIVVVFSAEAIIILIGGPFGWDFTFAADKRPSLYLWALLHKPLTGFVLYALGGVIAFSSIRCTRRKESG